MEMMSVRFYLEAIITGLLFSGALGWIVIYSRKMGLREKSEFKRVLRDEKRAMKKRMK